MEYYSCKDDNFSLWCASNLSYYKQCIDPVDMRIEICILDNACSLTKDEIHLIECENFI